MKPMLRARRNEILDDRGRQVAVVLAVNCPKTEAARLAQYAVDRENSVRRALNLKESQEQRGENDRG